MRTRRVLSLRSERRRRKGLVQRTPWCLLERRSDIILKEYSRMRSGLISAPGGLACRACSVHSLRVAALVVAPSEEALDIPLGPGDSPPPARGLKPGAPAPTGAGLSPARSSQRDSTSPSMGRRRAGAHRQDAPCNNYTPIFAPTASSNSEKPDSSWISEVSVFMSRRVLVSFAIVFRIFV